MFARVIRPIRGCFRNFVTFIRVIGVIRGSLPFYARSSKNIIWSRSYTSAPTEFFARRANENCLYYEQDTDDETPFYRLFRNIAPPYADPSGYFKRVWELIAKPLKPKAATDTLPRDSEMQ